MVVGESTWIVGEQTFLAGKSRNDMVSHNNFGTVGFGRARRSAHAVVARPGPRARSDAPYLAPLKLNAPMLL